MGSKEIKSENESVGDILRSSMTDLANRTKKLIILKLAYENGQCNHSSKR